MAIKHFGWLGILALWGCTLPSLAELPVTFEVQGRMTQVKGDNWNLKLVQASQTASFSAGADVVVAVVDTGADLNHPQLASRLLPMLDLVGTDRFTYEGQLHDYTGMDGNGHGTHVAGIVAGMFGNSPCKILPVKSIPNNGVGEDRTIAAGVRSAVDWRDASRPTRRVRVVNLSVGGKTRSKVLQDAIQYALSNNVLVVVSAGNDGMGVAYPASAAGVVAVSATNYYDQLSSYSNHGPELSVAAPGGDDDYPVESTWPSYLTASDYRKGILAVHTVQGMMGTSMAAPHVSGAAGLLFAGTPGASATQIKNRLESWVNDLGPIGPDAYFGCGRINITRALTKVAHDAND